MQKSHTTPRRTRPVEFQPHAGGFTLQAPGYTLAYDPARPYLRLSGAGGQLYADLFIGASLHTAAGLDSTARLSGPETTQTDERLTLRFELEGGHWTRKTLMLSCDARGIDAQVEVSGQGHLTDVHLFGGYYSGHLRWGSGFFESGAHFKQVFSPEPWGQERRTLPAGESTSLDVMGTSLPGKAHWFFTPAPLLYAFTGTGEVGGSLGADQGGTPQAAADTASEPEANWLAMSLVAPVQELNFSAFHYDAHESSFSLRLSYDGQTRVDGTFRTPPLRLEFAADPYAAIARNAELHRAGGLVALPSCRPARMVGRADPVRLGSAVPPRQHPGGPRSRSLHPGQLRRLSGGAGRSPFAPRHAGDRRQVEPDLRPE